MEVLAPIIEKLRQFSPGDLTEAIEIQDILEKTINAEETNFDDAALLSHFLERFNAFLKAGISENSQKDWEGLLRTLPKMPEIEDEQQPVPHQIQHVGLKTVHVDIEVLHSFLAESQEHLENIETQILSLEGEFDPKTVNDIFRSVHTIKGVAGFLSLDQIKSLSHELEFLLDALRSGTQTISADIIDLLLAGCDALLKMVTGLSLEAAKVETDKGIVELQLISFDLQEILLAIMTLRTPKPNQAPVSTSGSESPQAGELLTPEMVEKFLQDFFETVELVERCVLSIEKSGLQTGGLDEAFRAIHTLKGNADFFGYKEIENICMDLETAFDSMKKGELSIGSQTTGLLLGLVDQLRLQGPDDKNKGKAPLESASKEPENLGRYNLRKKDIRVDTTKLDRLFDLIGELITAEAMVVDNPDLKGYDFENFAKSAAYLSKITRELQAVSTAIRMVPLEGLFAKMNRLVRDLSRKFGKAVELELHGQETEMDRNIIEEISDPLVHILRNAIDHGIENEAIRRQKNKPLFGKIALSARYEGSEIWITVSDDGAGLNRDRIVEKALEKNLIPWADLPDQQVWALIFEPGFSTAKEISEISGRGVGMDVVKKNIEKLRGQISISTQRDQGTEFILKIPLTLAIIEGVTLRNGKDFYSLPFSSVVEFHNFDSTSLTKTDARHSVFRLREEILPIFSLGEIFLTQQQVSTIKEKQVVIVLLHQNRKLAVVVDEVVSYKQLVIKALPEWMANMKGVSGCSILGNGDVSLIVDVKALFDRCLE